MNRSISATVAFLALLAVAAGSAALTGCATTSPAAAPPSSSAEVAAAHKSATQASADAQILGAAVQSLVLDPPDFSDEPRGDVPIDGLSRVYAYISDISTSPASVTFDVAQLYFGDSAATQAALDRQPAPESQEYERNRYRHAQRLPVVAGAGAIGSFGGENDRTYGQDGWARFTPLTFEAFADRYAALAPGRRSAEGYWLTITPEGITSIVKQYQD